jgi:hypothetical protein
MIKQTAMDGSTDKQLNTCMKKVVTWSREMVTVRGANRKSNHSVFIHILWPYGKLCYVYHNYIHTKMCG